MNYYLAIVKNIHRQTLDIILININRLLVIFHLKIFYVYIFSSKTNTYYNITNIQKREWGCSSVVEYLTHMDEVMVQSSVIEKKSSKGM